MRALSIGVSDPKPHFHVYSDYKAAMKHFCDGRVRDRCTLRCRECRQDWREALDKIMLMQFSNVLFYKSVNLFWEEVNPPLPIKKSGIELPSVKSHSTFEHGEILQLLHNFPAV